jgi:SAM-dependent methyltransferase
VPASAGLEARQKRSRGRGGAGGALRNRASCYGERSAFGAGGCTGVGKSDDSELVLADQIAYYRAIATEYEDYASLGPWVSELFEALEAFRPSGHVLELACGIGTWTERLLRYATSVTAIDAAPEMLRRARALVGEERVRFIQADLFTWRPDCRYNVVFLAFWVSHVPLTHFASFWGLIAECLKPDGRVFFVDDAYRTSEELIEGESSSIIQRRTKEGTAFRMVKVAHRPRDLEDLLSQLGWQIKITPTSGPFYWGEGFVRRLTGRS